MELLDGRPLSAELTAGALPWRAAVKTCAAVAEALAAAHRHGIVHRDITPDNVMLTDNGVKVLDFGIATTVGAQDEDPDGDTFGTPAYVAPERLHGRRARPATDVYALGVMLYETLTGHPPYPADTWEELAAIRRDETPQPAPVAPGLPAAVAALCRRCLAADPIERPSAYQVAEELRRFLPGSGGGRHGARRALAVAGTASALALGLLLGATVLRPAPGADQQPTYRPPLAGPTTGPATGATDPVRPSPPPAATGTPRPDPSAGPSPPPGAGPELGATPPSPITLADLARLIEAGHESGEIRTDVALDLRQMIDNLRIQLAAGAADLPTATSTLREKVQTRASEGGMSVASAETLDAALNQLVE
jgi:serine/threonine-protein kinase